MKTTEWQWLVPQTFTKNGPFSCSSSEKPLSEEEEITMGPPQTMKKKKLKKILFSLGELASSSHHFNNINQLDHIQTLFSTSPMELAVALPRDPGMCLANYASSKLVYGYDSENDDDCYLYHGAFALGGDIEEDFARLHWMIDSGCTDHLSPFLDDFAHLGHMV